MRIILEEKKRKRFRALYELLFTNHRIPNYRISEKLHFRAVSRVIGEAHENQYIIGPEVRKCSHANTLEHVYLFNTEEPDITYMKYREDPRVVYNAQLYGFCNSLAISREKMDVEGDIVLEGPRSDYYIPYTPNQSFECALQNMQEKIRNFNPHDYTSREFIKTHWNETVKWDEDDEKIYRFLKYDLRKKKSSFMRNQHVSTEKINYWFETLDKRCTVHTSFYPETLTEYQSYLSMFDTDYEDFLIEVFSELPATPSFFKVQDKLILIAYYPGKFMNDVYTQSTKILSIPPLEVELLTREIVKKKKRALVGRSKKKDL